MKPNLPANHPFTALDCPPNTVMKNSLPVLTTPSCSTPRRPSSPARRLALAGLVLATVLGGSAQAGTMVKADNIDVLYLGTSWTNLAPPGPTDIGQWDHTVSAANTTNSLGWDQSWKGIAIVDPAGAVTINAGNTVTLGDSSGSVYYVVDMTNATVDLTLNCGVALSAPGGSQEWYVGSGRTVTVNGLVSGANQSYGLHKQGAGTLIMTNDNNTYPGVTDIRDGVLICSSLKDKSTPCSLGAPTSDNYGTIGIGGKDANGVSHVGTLRYVGPGDTSNRRLWMYGGTGSGAIDASGTGPLVIYGSGGAVFAGGSAAGFTKTLTLKGDNTDANTIGGTISDQSTTQKTALAKEGAGKWVLTVANPYTGGTTVRGGTLEIDANGSVKGNVSVANGAVFQLDNANALAATAVLTLDGSPSAGTVNLNFGGTQTINALYFGLIQQAAGTWGAVGSTASHTNGAFAGPGLLDVLSGATCSQTNAVLSVSNNLNGTITLTFQGSPQAQYYVVGSTNAAALMSNWLPVADSTTTVTNLSGRWQVTVTNTAPQKFYRAVAALPCS